MKNLFANKKFLVVLLIAIMVISTSTSFAFWLQGLHGSSTNSKLDISVGEGNTISTRVSANLTATTDAEKKLIPYTKASLIGTTNPNPGMPSFMYSPTEYTASILFTYQLVWTHDYPTDYYENEDAFLNITYSVFIGDNTTDDYSKIAGNTRPALFSVSNDFAGKITLDMPLDINFTLTMDEPISEEQYNTVTGLNGGLRVIMYFDVTTNDDINA